MNTGGRSGQTAARSRSVRQPKKKGTKGKMPAESIRATSHKRRRVS